MTENRPTVVIFDIGNVLIQWDPRHLYRSFFDGDEMLMDQFLDEVCTTAWNREMDRGLPWAEGVRRLTERFPECAELIRAYDEGWMTMVPDAVPGTPEILDELIERGTAVHAITNFSVEKFRPTLERFPFLRRFGQTVVSGEVGLLKPEPAIYRLLCERAGLLPGDAVFIDDSRENCEGAEAVGMRAHHFQGAGRLRRALEAYGLLPVVQAI